MYDDFSGCFVLDYVFVTLFVLFLVYSFYFLRWDWFFITLLDGRLDSSLVTGNDWSIC